MQKNKFYLLISIIVLICFFGTAALCNQCGADTIEETDGIIEEEVSVEEAIGENEDATPEIEEEESPKEEEKEEIEEETPFFVISPKNCLEILL